MREKCIATAAAACFAASASAAFVTPDFRGRAFTDFAGWINFTQAVGGPNLPDDPDTTAFDASLRQLTPGAVITSTGNLYSSSAIPSYVLEHDAPAPLREVVLQIRTLGFEIDYGSFLLRYESSVRGVQEISFTNQEELFRQDLGGFGGVRVDLLTRWDLTEIADDILAYEIVWGSDVDMISLSNMELDVRYIPGPGAATVLTLGVLASTRRRRD